MTITDLVDLIRHPDNAFIIATMTLIMCFLKLTLFKPFKRSVKRHKRNVRKSKEIIKRLGQFSNEPAKVIAYLRRTDPYVVEEVVLTAFSSAGFKIKRGTSYSNDGGIDGQVRIGGVQYYVQTKRYQKHISAEHVRDFKAVCARDNVKGLFVHTGRTGAMAKSDKGNSVEIISGMRLVELVTNNAFRLNQAA